MTTKQLFYTIKQIYQNKKLLKSAFENYDIIISSHLSFYDKYYEVAHIKPNGSLIKFKIASNKTTISNYILNYRFSNNIKNIAQSNTNYNDELIPQIIKNLITPIIREIKINDILE